MPTFVFVKGIRPLYLIFFGGTNITTLQIQEVCLTLVSMQASRYRYRYNCKESLTDFGSCDVAIVTSNTLNWNGYQADNFITFNTSIGEFHLNAGAAGKHIIVYQEIDPIQGLAGSSINIHDGVYVIPAINGIPNIVSTSYTGSHIATGEMGHAGRSFPNATNISTKIGSLAEVHGTHNVTEKWSKKLKKYFYPSKIFANWKNAYY